MFVFCAVVAHAACEGPIAAGRGSTAFDSAATAPASGLTVAAHASVHVFGFPGIDRAHLLFNSGGACARSGFGLSDTGSANELAILQRGHRGP